MHLSSSSARKFLHPCGVPGLEGWLCPSTIPAHPRAPGRGCKTQGIYPWRGRISSAHYRSRWKRFRTRGCLITWSLVWGSGVRMLEHHWALSPPSWGSGDQGRLGLELRCKSGECSKAVAGCAIGDGLWRWEVRKSLHLQPETNRDTSSLGRACFDSWLYTFLI